MINYDILPRWTTRLRRKGYYMSGYNPETDYPPHEQDNPYYNQTFGFVKRPHNSTVKGISEAVERVCSLKQPQQRKQRPLPSNKMYNKARPVVSLPVKRTGRKLQMTQRQKCGPNYFPVDNTPIRSTS